LQGHIQIMDILRYGKKEHNKMAHKKAVVFDIDGLMVDSEEVTLSIWKEKFREYGVDLTREYYTTLVGHSRLDIDDMLYRDFGSDIPFGRLLDETHEYMDTIPLPVKKGLMEILENSRRAGLIMGVATSSNMSHAANSLANIGVRDYFNVVICGDMVNKSKPEPDIYLKAIEKLGVRPDEVWVIEDAEAGVEAGLRAGADVICVPDMKLPAQEVLDRATAVVPDLIGAWEVIKADLDINT